MALLSENGLNVENIRGQGYDGAANMSTSYKGLQARIQRQNEKWSKGVESADAELVRTVSKFYGIEEEQDFTERVSCILLLHQK